MKGMNMKGMKGRRRAERYGHGHQDLLFPLVWPSLLFPALLLVVLLTSCSSGGVMEGDYHTGTSGLEMAFLEGYPDDQVYENEPMPVVLTVKNNGAYDVPYSKVLVTFAYDPLYLSGTTVYTFPQASDPTKTFVGRSYYYPEGSTETIDLYDFSTLGIVGMRESPETQLLAQLCYEYKTLYAGGVCVDVDTFLRSGREQVCTAEDLSASSQGAPVAFTNVQVRSLPVGTDGGVYARPEFVVTIQNVGDGIVIGPPQQDFASACNIKGLSDRELNAVKVSAAIMGIELVCTPSLVRLQDGVGETRCTVPNEQLGNPALVIQQNFYTPLALRAEYIYRQSIVKEIELQRQPGSEVGFSRFTGNVGGRRVKGYAYNADGTPLMTAGQTTTTKLSVEVKTAGFPATFVPSGDTVTVQIPPGVQGSVTVSLVSAGPAQISAVGTAGAGVITARTPDGDVKAIVTSDLGASAGTSVEGNTLRIMTNTVASQTTGTVTVQLVPSQDYSTKTQTTIAAASAISGATLSLIVPAPGGPSRQATMCEVLSQDPTKAREIGISERLVPSIERFLNANFACACSREQCLKLDDDGRCVYGLCPGALYCCDVRSKEQLDQQQRQRTVTQGGVPGNLESYKATITSASCSAGVYPSIVAAQFKLESNAGLSMPPNSNNPFGIKCPESWKGTEQCTIPTTTKECDAVTGHCSTVKDYFRKFPSVENALSTHALRLLGKEPGLSAVITDPFSTAIARKDYAGAITALQRYATDPKYTDKLRNIVYENHLEGWDGCIA